MKLIAESGSTRTEWALVEDNHLIQRVFTEGLNPFFQTRREISRSVRLGLPETFFKRKLEHLRRARGIACRKRCACCGCAIPITLPERLWRRNIWQHLSVIIRRSVSSSTSPTSFSPCVRFSLLPRLRSFPTSCCCTP